MRRWLMESSTKSSPTIGRKRSNPSPHGGEVRKSRVRPADHPYAIGPNRMCALSQRVPFVIESTGRGEREMDIFSRLLKDRIIFITGGIDDDVSNLVIAELLFLSNEDA